MQRDRRAGTRSFAQTRFVRTRSPPGPGRWLVSIEPPRIRACPRDVSAHCERGARRGSAGLRHGDTRDTEMKLPQSHRDTELQNINRITQRIIGCAIEVHRILGPGLLESVYEEALSIEFDTVGLQYQRQV